MEMMGTIGGGAAVMKRYIATATVVNAGVPFISTADGGTNIGEVLAMTTSTALTQGNIGLGVDTTGTVAAAITDTNDVLVTIAVNPDLIIRAKMNNGSTEDTALTIVTVTSASATGIVLGGYTSLAGESVWGYDGANKGQLRKFDDTSGGVGISFANAIANGDRFLTAAGNRCMTLAAGNPFPDITTLLTQMDVDTAGTADNDNFTIMDGQFGTEDDDGENNSFYHLIQNRHAFGAAALTA